MTKCFEMPIDKARVRQAFSRAASQYDAAAVLQHEIGARMRERLPLVRLQPQVVLDLGCGTGKQSEALLREFPKATVIGMDFALPMVGHACRRGRWWRRPWGVCADMEALPLKARSVDLIYSNLAFQWAKHPEILYRECLRVLRPGGLLMFSTFGPDTLKELRAAWAMVDEDEHVSPFMDMHDVGDLLLRVGFSAPVMDVDRVCLTYAKVEDLLRDLKAIGAHNASVRRPSGLTGKGRLQAMYRAYESFRRNGLLPASYEVVYGHAWAPELRTAVGTKDAVLSVFEVGRGGVNTL